MLGLDEISLKKGYQDYVTLITSKTKDGVKILGVLKGRDKATVKAFLIFRNFKIYGNEKKYR